MPAATALAVSPPRQGQRQNLPLRLGHVGHQIEQSSLQALTAGVLRPMRAGEGGQFLQAVG